MGTYGCTQGEEGMLETARYLGPVCGWLRREGGRGHEELQVEDWEVDAVPALSCMTNTAISTRFHEHRRLPSTSQTGVLTLLAAGYWLLRAHK